MARWSGLSAMGLVAVVSLVGVGLAACSSGATGSQCAGQTAVETGGATSSVHQALEDEGTCIGNPTPCGSFSGLGCSQEGCSVDIGRYDDPSDDRCRGYPPSCTSRSSKSRCQDVKGCTWKVKSTTATSSSSSSSGDSLLGAGGGTTAPPPCPSSNSTSSPSPSGQSSGPPPPAPTTTSDPTVPTGPTSTSTPPPPPPPDGGSPSTPPPDSGSPAPPGGPGSSGG